LNEEIKLRALSFDELVAIDNYKSATSNALAATAAMADKIVAAAFSVGTAYGAVVALVAPKDSASPLLVIAPFAVLALALGIALWGEGIGVPITSTTTTEQARTSVTSTITTKRRWNNAAIVVLVVAMALAGYVLYDTYRPTAGSKMTVTIWLTSAGARLVDQACGMQGTLQIKGQVENLSDLSSKRVQVDVDKTACKSGAGTIVLPQAAIDVVKK
jgi:hypothetical protein